MNVYSKTFLTALPFFLILSVAQLKAQNVQLHYDFGEERKFLTSTVEMFKPDEWGSTFFFIDMDYDLKELNGISMAYWEFARDFKFWDAPVTLHAEYNGGLGRFHIPDGLNGAYSINNAWLGGVTYSFNNNDFTKGITFQAMYKYIRDKHNAAFQLTAIWYAHFFNKKLSFLGFADFWREDMLHKLENGTSETTKFIVLTEPQLWYNVTSNLSLGSEVEFGYNFGTFKGLKIMPTLAAKWQF